MAIISDQKSIVNINQRQAQNQHLSPLLTEPPVPSPRWASLGCWRVSEVERDGLMSRSIFICLAEWSFQKLCPFCWEEASRCLGGWRCILGRPRARAQREAGGWAPMPTRQYGFGPQPIPHWEARCFSLKNGDKGDILIPKADIHWWLCCTLQWGIVN